MSSTDLVPRRTGFVSPFGTAVDALHVTVNVAGEQVFGEVRGWYHVTVTILPGHAERVGDTRLRTELAQLARLLFAARTKEYYRLVAEHLEPDPIQLRRSRSTMEDALSDELVSGADDSGAVEVVSIGMTHWTVTVAPGSCARLGSEGLSAAATQASTRLVEAWLEVLARYKAERWGRR